MTIQSLALKNELINRVIRDILEIDIGDECLFKITNMTDIRDGDQYDGLRITILGSFQSLQFHFKLDLSAGDRITPHAVKKTFELNIIKKSIELYAYNFETVLAEKLQTIIARGVANTRAKDYFDAYSILTLEIDALDLSVLKEALMETMRHRQTTYTSSEIIEILDSINNSEDLLEIWDSYRSEYPYVNHLSFDVIFQVIKEWICNLVCNA